MDTKVSAEALREYLISCRRTLHQMPELHFELPQTTAFVASQLQELSIPYQIVENGGIVARIRGKEGKNAFLLRADMDALPLLEQSGESFASTNGRMHACGHDIHTAMLLGAARLLKEREESLPGTVLLVFQSNEEGIAGMQVLLDHGLLDKDHVGAALALHVLPGHGMDAGTYSCLPGPANASVDEYRIEIRGKGTHGAMPYKGVDPINVGIHICNALAAMMTKEVDGRQVTVLSNGYFNSGSPLAYNIIPNTALVGGGLRTLDNQVAEYVKARMRNVAQAISSAFLAECSVTFPTHAPACVNDGALAALVDRCASELGMVNQKNPPQLASDDFSHLSVRIPSCYIWLGAGGPEEIYDGGVLHDPRVRFNEDAMPFGVALMASAALRWLEEHRH